MRKSTARRKPLTITQPHTNKHKQKFTYRKNTAVYEDFNPNFKQPKIYSSKEIFTEKQLREFTSTYSEDNRSSFLDGLAGLGGALFAGKPKESSNSPVSSSLQKSLKATVSLKVLEEKTEAYLKGSINANAFYKILKAAFGDKISSVLPEILSNLPPKKAKDLTSAAK